MTNSTNNARSAHGPTDIIGARRDLERWQESVDRLIAKGVRPIESLAGERRAWQRLVSTTANWYEQSAARYAQHLRTDRGEEQPT